MYESMRGFPSSLFGQLDRLRREFDDMFGFSGRPASIRSVPPGSYPAINIGNTPAAIGRLLDCRQRDALTTRPVPVRSDRCGLRD